MIYNNPVDYKIEVVLKCLMHVQTSMQKNLHAHHQHHPNAVRLGDRFAILCGVDTLPWKP